MLENKDRAIFANQLRGLAVIAVMIVHWCGVYWFAREKVAAFIHAPVLPGPPSSLESMLTPGGISYGPLGVSIFFMISGFVIPFSLARTPPLEFIVARILRIFPTYIAGSALMLLFVWLSCQYWGAEFELDWRRLTTNLLLVNENLLIPSIDLVNWTLAIEIKFYVACALMVTFVRRGTLMPMVLFGLAVLCLCEWYPAALNVVQIGTYRLSIESLQTDLMCVTFMLIGVGFYHHYLGNITSHALACYAAVMLLIFFSIWSHTWWRGQLITQPLNYLYGFLMFLWAYSCRRFFRPFAPLDFLAKVSFPLYVIHSIIGYATMRMLMDVGLPYRYAILVTLAMVLLLAYFLHLAVERPTMHAGRTLFQAIRQSRSTAPAGNTSR
jgi:peptidoglycan/LPS O-acetylase OafA/YrhL